MNDTITADVPGWGTLTLYTATDRPARAAAMLAVSSAIVRGTSDADGVRALVEGRGTLEQVEEQHARIYASHGLLIGYAIRARDGAPWKLDAVARLSLPNPTCPACASDESVVVAGQRRCVSCSHVWDEPTDARRYVGPGWQRAFGDAVCAELAAAGLSRKRITQIGVALHTALTRSAGGVEEEADVSFS